MHVVVALTVRARVPLLSPTLSSVLRNTFAHRRVSGSNDTSSSVARPT